MLSLPSRHGGQPQEGAETTVGRGDDLPFGTGAGGELPFPSGVRSRLSRLPTPVPVVKNGTVDNFRKFAKWAMKEKGMKMEKYEPGALDQIRRRKDASHDFHVRNLTANGIVWTGVGTDTHNFLSDWKGEAPNENPLCLSMTIRYGAFRYFTGADLDTAIQTKTAMSSRSARWACRRTGRRLWSTTILATTPRPTSSFRRFRRGHT